MKRPWKWNNIIRKWFPGGKTNETYSVCLYDARFIKMLHSKFIRPAGTFFSNNPAIFHYCQNQRFFIIRCKFL